MGEKPRRKKRSLEDKLQLIRAWVTHFENLRDSCFVRGNTCAGRQEGHVATVLRRALSTIGQNDMPAAILIIRALQLQYYNSYRAVAEQPEGSNLKPDRNELWAVAENLADVVKVLEDRYSS